MVHNLVSISYQKYFKEIAKHLKYFKFLELNVRLLYLKNRDSIIVLQKLRTGVLVTFVDKKSQNQNIVIMEIL